jgi:hypothetical protein
MKTPATGLVARATDDRHGRRTGADDDNAAFAATERAGMGDVDVVIDFYAGKGPRPRGKLGAGRIHAAARHAEAGIGIGGLGIIDAGCLEYVAGTVADRLIGGVAGIDLQIGTAVFHFGQRHQILVGQTHAAIGATTVDAKIISGHAGSP